VEHQSDTDTVEVETEGTALDRSVAQALGYFSQRTSRRGVLAKIGKGTLALLGATVAYEVLPVDRTTADAASCGDWQLCGIYGKICSCCNGNSGLNVCPACSSWFNHWNSCCCQNWWTCNWVLYWDCCNCCVSCGGSGCIWCTNNSVQPAWCNGGTYCCTAVVISNGC
jgi:hypothetical protein